MCILQTLNETCCTHRKYPKRGDNLPDDFKAGRRYLKYFSISVRKRKIENKFFRHHRHLRNTTPHNSPPFCPKNYDQTSASFEFISCVKRKLLIHLFDLFDTFLMKLRQQHTWYKASNITTTKNPLCHVCHEGRNP